MLCVWKHCGKVFLAEDVNIYNKGETMKTHKNAPGNLHDEGNCQDCRDEAMDNQQEDIYNAKIAQAINRDNLFDELVELLNKMYYQELESLRMSDKEINGGIMLRVKTLLNKVKEVSNG